MRHSVLWSAKSSIVVVGFNLTVPRSGDGPLGIPGDKSVVCLFFWILFQTPLECFCGVEDKRDCPRIAGNCVFVVKGEMPRSPLNCFERHNGARFQLAIKYFRAASDRN